MRRCRSLWSGRMALPGPPGSQNLEFLARVAVRDLSNDFGAFFSRAEECG